MTVLLLTLPLLRVLSVEGCKMLTDAALVALQAHGAERVAGLDGHVAPLVRLNLSWVDGISNAALHGALRGSCMRATAGGRASSPLQILDYWGAVWGVSADGQPARCELREVTDVAELPRTRLKGWVAAFDASACNPNAVMPSIS